MLAYSREPNHFIEREGFRIASFLDENGRKEIVEQTFNEEWSKFSKFSEKEISKAGDQYFDIVDESMLNSTSTVMDLGCGSGRWTRYVAPKAGFVEALDVISSVHKAAIMNKDKKNVRITQAGVFDIPFPDQSFDFIFCLGVLHHLEQPFEALKAASLKLKPGGHFLIYLYYKLDGAGWLNRLLFHFSVPVRIFVSSLPSRLKLPLCDFIAVVIYLPLVFFARLLKIMVGDKKWLKFIPLIYYTDKSLRIIRNDALDRFGTPVEKRFSKAEVEDLLENAGLKMVKVSDKAPFWHAVARKIL